MTSGPNFNVDSFATLIASDGTNFLNDLPSEDLNRAMYEWAFWARPDQQAPTQKDWTTWLILGGRGAGKTRTGAEWITQKVRDGIERIALVGETYEDVREVMIDGPSGLCAVGYPEARPTYEPSRHRLIWPSGAKAHVFSAEDPEGLRGHQFEAAWSDEIGKWRMDYATWHNLQLGLRLGDRPRQVVTTTPRPTKLIKSLLDNPSTVTSRASTYRNRGHLADAFLSQIASAYEGTRLGRQELLGEVLEDRAGALWRLSMIDAARIGHAPPLDRIVVAVDPPVSTGPDADECGIIVAGCVGAGATQLAYVLHDGTVKGMSPTGWARQVATIMADFKADRIVAEVNQGGDLVTQMLRLAAPCAPVRSVRATRGKTVRAEPIAALYEQGRVKHVGHFPQLEDQMTQFTGHSSDASPDRLDALVWALTDLMMGASGTGPAIRSL